MKLAPNVQEAVEKRINAFCQNAMADADKFDDTIRDAIMADFLMGAIGFASSTDMGRKVLKALEPIADAMRAEMAGTYP